MSTYDDGRFAAYSGFLEAFSPPSGARVKPQALLELSRLGTALAALRDERVEPETRLDLGALAVASDVSARRVTYLLTEQPQRWSSAFRQALAQYAAASSRGVFVLTVSPTAQESDELFAIEVLTGSRTGLDCRIVHQRDPRQIAELIEVTAEPELVDPLVLVHTSRDFHLLEHPIRTAPIDAEYALIVGLDEECPTAVLDARDVLRPATGMIVAEALHLAARPEAFLRDFTLGDRVEVLVSGPPRSRRAVLTRPRREPDPGRPLGSMVRRARELAEMALYAETLEPSRSLDLCRPHQGVQALEGIRLIEMFDQAVTSWTIDFINLGGEKRS